jgi:hypothetical protein
MLNYTEITRARVQSPSSTQLFDIIEFDEYAKQDGRPRPRSQSYMPRLEFESRYNGMKQPVKHDFQSHSKYIPGLE